jgi:hypothetical protein
VKALSHSISPASYPWSDFLENFLQKANPASRSKGTIGLYPDETSSQERLSKRVAFEHATNGGHYPLSLFREKALYPWSERHFRLSFSGTNGVVVGMNEQ